MSSFSQRYKIYGQNKKLLFSLIVSLFFLVVGLVVTYFAIVYATKSVSFPVTDIILSNLRVFDVDGIFVYGPVIFWGIIIVYLFGWQPKKMPFVWKSLALALVIRSAFIILTHIAPFPIHDQAGSANGIIGVFTNGDDLFFSGHTGLPFLLALIFWQTPWLRWFCLTTSVFFGIIVLMAHLHYSIDVFGAFFIVYTIFHLATKFFKADQRLFFQLN